MFNYCQDFREIELQIINMDFIERLEHFVDPLSPECTLFIYNLPVLYREEDMEVVYRAARQ